MRLFLDASIFLRAILGDVTEKAQHCLNLLGAIDDRQHDASTSVLVLNEILWVLEGLKVPAREIVPRMVAIAQSRVNILPSGNHDSVEQAVDLYASEKVDFQDALNAITARDAGIRVIVSYDRHFDRIDFVERREPDCIPG